jgi:hypothetical protein
MCVSKILLASYMKKGRKGKERKGKEYKGCFIITEDKLLMIFFILFLDIEG